MLEGAREVLVDDREAVDGAPAGRLEALLKSKASLDGAIEQLYLVTFARPPRPEEMTRTREWVAKAPSLREGLSDLLWVLVNAREFQFNH